MYNTHAYTISLILYRHQCMVMRGVQKSDALTVTSTFTGEFETNKEVRQEFLNLVNKRR